MCRWMAQGSHIYSFMTDMDITASPNEEALAVIYGNHCTLHLSMYL